MVLETELQRRFGVPRVLAMAGRTGSGSGNGQGTTGQHGRRRRHRRRFERRRVPGATVALTHIDTNATSTVVTDGNGQYRTAPLRIGEYTVTVELPGFKTFVQRGVVLNIGDVRKVDARLQLGDVAEQITVSRPPCRCSAPSTRRSAPSSPTARSRTCRSTAATTCSSRRSRRAPCRRPASASASAARPAARWRSCSTGRTTTTSRSPPGTRARKRW